MLWILETSADVLAESPDFSTMEAHVAYARGYFDAEGGVPRDHRHGCTSSLCRRAMRISASCERYSRTKEFAVVGFTTRAVEEIRIFGGSTL
jgi:hypothetical protein